LFVFLCLLVSASAQAFSIIVPPDIDYTDLPGQFGWSPLITAVLRGDAGIVQKLVGKGANLPVRDKAGRTALDYGEEHDEREDRGNPEEQPGNPH